MLNYSIRGTSTNEVKLSDGLNKDNLLKSDWEPSAQSFSIVPFGEPLILLILTILT